jgi:hypothetical protein
MKPGSSTWKLLSALLMATGIGWVIYLFLSTVDDLSRFLPDSIGWLVAATFLVALSIGMMVIIFGLFLNSGTDRCYPPGLITRLHIAGQLLRYLPGRLWGVVFQISAAHETIPAVRIARANLDFMVFSVIGSLCVGCVLLAYRGQWPWWTAAVAVIGGGITIGGLLLGGSNRILRLVGRFLPERARRICELLSMGQPTLPRLASILGVFMVSWAAYLAGWSLLGLVFNCFAQVDFISLCAYYTLASGIGIASMLTPAGLGVREAAFVMLVAGSADRETAAFFAVFGRVWLMLVEMLLLAFIALFFFHKKE